MLPRSGVISHTFTWRQEIDFRLQLSRDVITYDRECDVGKLLSAIAASNL